MNRRRMGAKAGVMTAAVAVVVAMLAVTSAARAQEVNLATLDDGGANRVYARGGEEYGFVASVGYGRTVRLLGRTLLLTGDLTSPWAGADASDFRVRAGVLAPIVGYGGWRLAGSLAPTVRGTKNDVSRMTNVGADLGLAGGYYGRRWFVAAEAGFDWALTTHVSHTDYYRDTVFAEAEDGWYSATGGNLRYGVQAGVSVGRFDVALRAGQLRDLDGGTPLIPLYATLSFGARW